MVMNVYMLRMEMLWLIRSVCGWELSANKVQADKGLFIIEGVVGV